MAIPIVMPRLGDFMTEGVLTRFTKSPGEEVKQGEVIAEIETEKVNYDLESTDSGIFHPTVEAGETVMVDAVMCYLLGEGESPPPVVETKAQTQGTRATKGPGNRRNPNIKSGTIPSTPGARKLATKLGVDLSNVTPTGPRGRVVEADVRKHAESQTSQGKVPAGLPDPAETVQLSGIRKAIAVNMKASLSETAQLSYFLEIDVTEAQSRRREFGCGLGDVIIKATAETLKKVPLLNSVLSGDQLLKFDQVNMAVAVALEDGLVVPVIADVGNKGLSEIGEAVKDLSERARSGSIRPDELVGGTFTISILGVVDGFTPILNQSQVALLGVGRTVQKPVVKSGEVVIREMITLSLTGDHQVVDGAVAASFFRRLQQAIERPGNLFK